MCKQKLIKRPPAPAVEKLMGKRARAPLCLSLLVLLVLVCRCSSSAAPQHLNPLNESVGVDGAFDASSSAAGAAAVGDAGDGEGGLEQVLNPGLRPVNVKWIRNAMKKFGWYALGSAATVLLLALLVAAGIFAAATPKVQSDPTVPAEEEEEEKEKEEVKEEKKVEETPRSRELKYEGEAERSEIDEASQAGAAEKPAQEPSREEQQQQEDVEGHDEGETEREEEEDESGGEEKDGNESEILREGIGQEEEATEEEKKEGTEETEEEGGDEKDQGGRGEETSDGESGAANEGEGEAEMSTADDASQAGAGEKPSQESSQEAQQQQEDAEGHDEGEAEMQEEEDESGGEEKDEKEKEISGEGIEQEEEATEEEEKEGTKETEEEGGDEKDQEGGGEETFDGESGAANEAEGEAEMSTADEASQAGGEEELQHEPPREEEEQQREVEKRHDEAKTKKEKEEDESGRKEEGRESGREGVVKEEEGKGGESEKKKETGEMEKEGGYGKNEDLEEETYDGENVATQLALLQQLEDCLSPADSLAASLRVPMSTALLGQLKGRIEAAIENRSAAELGDPEAGAALVAANYEAVVAIVDLQTVAREVLARGARTVVACPDAIDAVNVSKFLKYTGVSHSLELAWYQAAQVCEMSIRSMREDGQRTLEKMQILFPLSDGMLVLSPERLFAARAAVEATYRYLEGEEAAREAETQLQHTASQLLRSKYLLDLEPVAAKLACQGRTAFSFLQVVSTIKRAGKMSPEDIQLLGKWEQCYNNAQGAISSVQQHLQVLRDETSMVMMKKTADEARTASAHAETLLAELLTELPSHMRPSIFQLVKLLLRPDILSAISKSTDVTTTLMPIVDAAAATEQQLLKVGRQIELQLSELTSLPWAPKLLVENAEKQLKSVLVSGKEDKQTFDGRVADIINSGPSRALFDGLNEGTSALKKHCEAVCQLNAEVEVLLALSRLVETAQSTEASALEMMAGGMILQPAEHQQVSELRKRLEHAVATARRANNLPAVVQAVGEYVTASQRLLQLVRVSKLEGLLKNDTATAAELQATKAVQEKLKPGAAGVAQDGEVEEEKAPLEAALTKASYQGEGFGRQTTAKPGGEATQGEENEEGKENDDQDSYETASESEGHEESEDGDEYDNALEWSESSYKPQI